MELKLNTYHRNVTDEDLISDLLEVKKIRLRFSKLTD